MKRPLLTLLLASALAFPLSAHAAGLGVGSSGSAGGSAGVSGSAGVGGLSAGVNSNTSAGASTSGSTSNIGNPTRTDLGKRQAIQSDTMARPNGPLNDPDTITSGTTTATGIDTNSNASVNATTNTSTTNPNTTLGGGTNTSTGVISNARTNNGTGIGLGNGSITDGALANGTAGSATTNVGNGITAAANGNIRLDAARVRAVQTALKNKGYYTGSVDGRWGGATSRALQKFQIENRLSATGQADASTLNELDISGHLSGAGAAAVNPAAQ